MRYLTRIPFHSSILSIAGLTALATIAGCASSERKADHPEPNPTYGYAPPEENEAGMKPASRELTPSESARAPASSPATEPTPAQPTEMPAEPLDDAQIAAITDAANSGEVEQARLALTKAKNARVRKFAQMMVKDHGQAKKDGAKLATELKLTPVENSTSGTLREESTMLISRLKDEQANFDHAYISAQVEGHRKVLDLFDKRLIPSARDPKVLAMLQTNRPKIEAHLNEALEIQSALESAGANRAGAMPQSGTGAEQNTPHQHDHSRPSDPSSGAAP